jgi:hypothetical protein
VCHEVNESTELFLNLVLQTFVDCDGWNLKVLQFISSFQVSVELDE